MRRLLAALALGLALAPAAAALADVVHLKDGTELKGTIKRNGAGNGWVVTDAAGKFVVVTDDQVQRVEKVGNLSKDDIARSALISVRRNLDTLNDPKVVLDRLRKFTDDHAGTVPAHEVAKELPQWQERIDKGMTRVGARWVSADEMGQLLSQTTGLLEQARALIRQNKPKEADALLTQVFAIDPGSVAATYLRGLVQFSQEQVPLSRRSFETVKAAIPDHAPTLNNLGVLNYRQNQIGAAMTFYAQAMLASPQNKDVLNNVAEALHKLPPDQLTGTQAQRALKAFREQDVALAQQMASQGWYRWGATWVTAVQMEEIRKADAAVKVKVNALQVEFERHKARMISIDREIDDDRADMDRIQGDRLQRDASGRTYVNPLPDIYYRIQQRVNRLIAEKQELVARQRQLEERARGFDAERPKPHYTGFQQLIGVEGAPMPAAPAAMPGPTPAPATQPSLAP